jgi:hypothetical protein
MGTKLYRGSPSLFRDSFFLFEKTVYLILPATQRPPQILRKKCENWSDIRRLMVVSSIGAIYFYLFFEMKKEGI